MPEIPNIPNPTEFLCDTGLLFEINRQIMHPLGLALSIVVSDEPLGGQVPTFSIQDFRDDPEGVLFDPDVFGEAEEKLARFMETNAERLRIRQENLGFLFQSKGT